MLIQCLLAVSGLYADDIILLSATVDGLQKILALILLRNCLTFNCKKSVCIAIGPRLKHTVSDMCLNSESISWCESIRYLGVDVYSWYLL